MRRLSLLLVCVLLLAGCGAPAGDGGAPAPTATPAVTPAATPPATPATTTAPATPAATTPGAPSAAEAPRFGVSYSPAAGQSPLDFLAEAKDVGGLVLWGGDVRELESGSGAPDVIATLARQQDVAFAAQVGFHHAGEAFDAAAQERASEAVIAFAERAKPAFLVLGVELDRIAATDPSWVDAFATWYDGAYDDVKAVSPATLVFPSFQLERTMGLTGGLYGAAGDAQEMWSVVDQFPMRDATAFTTYPGLIYGSPQEVPPDHYLSLADRYVGPIAFTEAGWHAGATIPGWESSETEQAAFVDLLLADAGAIDARFTVWLALHDQEAAPEPFDTMGLVGPDGPREAYAAWAALTDV